MSSDQQLLDEWRQVIDRLEALRSEPVDALAQKFRAELEAREASLAAQIRAAGLMPETVQPRVGSWSPLPLFEDDHPERDEEADQPGEVESSEVTAPERGSVSYEKLATVVDELFDRSKGRKARKRVRRWLRDPARSKEVDAKGARLLACVLDEISSHAQADVVRAEFRLTRTPLPGFLPPLRLSQPWVPSPIDGFTSAQRVIVKALREMPTELRRLKVVLDEASVAESAFSRAALTNAVDELLLPRPIPVVESVFGRTGEERLLKLTRAGRCMPFFPNLLVNGCCQPLRFPVYRLERVVEAARLMLRHGSLSGSAFGTVLGDPQFGGPRGQLSSSVYLFGSGTVSFEADLKVSSGGKTLAVSLLAPPLSGQSEFLESVCQAAEGVVSFTNDGERLVVTLEHQAFLNAFVPGLSRTGALGRVVEVAHTVDLDGRHAPMWVGGLIQAWLESCRATLRERVAPSLHAAEERLHVLDGLLRAADHEAAVFRIVDLSLSNTEAEWALKNVGSDAFRSHSTFSRIDTGSLSPFTEAQAKVIVKTRSLSARRQQWLDERAECRREFARLELSELPDPTGVALLAELEQMVAVCTA